MINTISRVHGYVHEGREMNDTRSNLHVLCYHALHSPAIQRARISSRAWTDRNKSQNRVVQQFPFCLLIRFDEKLLPPCSWISNYWICSHCSSFVWIRTQRKLQLLLLNNLHNQRFTFSSFGFISYAIRILIETFKRKLFVVFNKNEIFYREGVRITFYDLLSFIDWNYLRVLQFYC